MFSVQEKHESRDVCVLTYCQRPAGLKGLPLCVLCFDWRRSCGSQMPQKHLQKFTTCHLLLSPAHFLSLSSVFLPTLNVCPGSECWKAWSGVLNPLYFRNVFFSMETGHRARINVSGSSFYPSGNKWMTKNVFMTGWKRRGLLMVYILMKIKKTKIFFFGF